MNGPKFRSLRRLSCVGVICVLHVGTQHPAWAAPHIVTVRGQAHFTTEVRRDADRVMVRGTIADDADEPIGNADIALSLSPPSTPLTMCEEQRGPSRGRLKTNQRGQFCIATPGELARNAVLRLSYAGSEWIDGTAKEVELGRAHRTLQLGTEPASIEAAAGDPAAILIRAREGAAAAAGVRILLSDEQGSELGRAETDSTGKAELRVTDAGSPGSTTWTVRTEGDDTWYPAETRIAVTRRATATLVPRKPRIFIWDQAGAVSVEVDISCRFPASGTIELWLAGQRVASAPVQNNAAILAVETAALGDGARNAELRYVGTSEQIRAAASAVTLDARPRQALRAFGILAGLASLLIFAFGRSAWLRRVVTRLRTRRPRPAAAATPIASARDAAGSRRYLGHVVDAYTHKPIAGAQIKSIDVTFSTESPTLKTQSNEHGEFEVAISQHAIERWEISANGYRTREVPNGELSLIRLLSRKNALVADLVDWARAVGAPFDQKPETTPGHIAAVSNGVGEAAVWARAIEQAAFSPEAIDEARDEALQKTRPRTIPLADDLGEEVR